MKIKTKSINNRITKIVIFMFFFALLFITSSNKVTYHGDIFVQYFTGEKSNIILYIGIIGVMFTIINKLSKKMSIDSISILLIMRFLLFVIFNIVIDMFGLMDTKFQPGIMLAYFLSFCFFFIGSSNDNKKFISQMCFLSVIVITIQLTLTYIGRNLIFSNTIDMKWWMVIPIGQTNTVGCYLIGMLMYIYCALKNKKIIFVAAVCSLISILLTYSRSGLIMYMLFIIYIIFKDLKSNNRKGKIRTILIMIIGLCIVGMVSVNYIDFFERFSIDSMSSSRIKVYAEGLQLLGNHLFIGVGAYSFHIYDAYKAHNWVLETLIENGMLGAFVYFFIIAKIFKKIKKISPEMIEFLIFYLIHGLVEPNLYTANFDAFFWLLVGSCLFKSELKGENVNEDSM